MKPSICLICSLLLLAVPAQNIRADFPGADELDNQSAAAKRAALRPLRWMNGVLTDLTPLLEWCEKYPGYEKPVTPARPLKNWRLIGGEVVQVLDQGVLVRSASGLYAPIADQPIFVRGLPNKKVLIDGKFVADAAVQVDRFQYVSTTGAKLTVAAFDCGGESSEAERTFRSSPSPTRSAAKTMQSLTLADMDPLGAIAILLVALLVYFIPAFNAHARKHRNAGAISLLNLLLGWTLIGWIAAVVWSATADIKDPNQPDV